MSAPARTRRRGIQPGANLSVTEYPHTPVRPDVPPEVHPVCLLLPNMTPADFKNLVEDIKTHGQRHSVLLYEDKILDGRHRARACEQLGIETHYEAWSGPDPVAFVLSENLHRRHLTPSQKAIIVAKAMDWHRAAAAVREKAGKAHDEATLAPRGARVNKSGKATETAGVAVGVSARSVERALKIAKEGTTEDEQEVLAGKTTVNAKLREIAARTKAAPKPQPQPAPPAQAAVTAPPPPASDPAPAVRQPAPSEDEENAPVTLTFDDYDWERLRAMAKVWCVPVTSLAKQFVLLRLTDEEERREGLWGGR
ncbi:ParB N-terminal domain-containing protein [uncultured Lamprocystis sp.]|jgi:ParB-like chromosome segregation protein Spo0J|uniref:ParB N-terminal domain-containing protein n=1 Tax=uncultured Lamprocystis sp. TaxID=543132 RepID=UPI0025EF4E29|nr:ParB N-terminal domain-containing protein [uncultured Lamprocystis sp.]